MLGAGQVHDLARAADEAAQRLAAGSSSLIVTARSQGLALRRKTIGWSRPSSAPDD